VRIKSLKIQWENAVKDLDVKAILQASQINNVSWLYFNHFRLFELVDTLGIIGLAIHGFDGARERGLVTDDGRIVSRNTIQPYMYNDGDAISLYLYVKSIMENGTIKSYSY
jgi:hypothetical protein